MTTIDASCKFCKTPLKLEIDEEYAKLNDPYRLVPLAACDRCADLRVRRRYLHEALAATAAMLVSHPADAEIRNKAHGVFTTLTKRYLKLISDWTDNTTLVWEEAIAEDFVRRPKAISTLIAKMWGMANQNNLKL